MALLDMAGLDIYESVASFLNADLSTRSDVAPFVRERTRRGPARHQDREGRLQLHARTRRGAAGGARRPLRRRAQGAGGARMTLLRGPSADALIGRRAGRLLGAQASSIGAGASPARRASGTGLRVSQLRPASPHQSASTGIRSSTCVQDRNLAGRRIEPQGRLDRLARPGLAEVERVPVGDRCAAGDASRAFIRRGEGNRDNALRAAGDRPRLLGGRQRRRGRLRAGRKSEASACVVTCMSCGGNSSAVERLEG